MPRPLYLSEAERQAGYARRRKLLDEDTYDIGVKRVTPDIAAESVPREHWSQEPITTHMDDGGETYQVTGVMAGQPEVVEEYEITYPGDVEGAYGTITFIKYVRKAGKDGFERLQMGVSQCQFVDIKKQNGKLLSGSNAWTSPGVGSALVSLQSGTEKRGLDRIIPKLSPEAAAFVRELLATDHKNYR